MSLFVTGQRWINDAELMMGLGTVVDVEHRTVSILFQSTGETRTYAKESAPLTRIIFKPGDEINDIRKRKLTVKGIDENDHLITYRVETQTGEIELLNEENLDTAIQLNKPLERLISGQVDDIKWYRLRNRTWQNLLKNHSSGIAGLTGARTSLIPHQLYIANEVASRYAPRVLLADEVGLGKTIEAGLILHQQLSTGRASRVLIIVPEALIHQWLVEMLRRFNLFFSIFDEERCLAIEESTDFSNPFNAEQKIICSSRLFTREPQRFEQVTGTEWDLLVVDEAHHLEWSAEHISDEYKLVEQLARISKGLLLLTATPEQLGRESHFARLRLLDADKFNDYDSFIQQENQYQIIADLIEQINADQPLSDNMLNQLRALESNVDTEQLKCGNLSTKQKNEITHHLLDCHGTGRVLFRNTRAAIKGFPERNITAYPLDIPREYQSVFDDPVFNDMGETAHLLTPEKQLKTSTDWTTFDPRVKWLVDFLGTHRNEKILLITHHADTARELSTALKTQYGIASGVFHEQLSIIDRDKRAADFADTESGVQILMCSEIGSEGRNFQFSHHLILFDLPLNPDLLEQRIGRLDRIGQTHTIELHAPYFNLSAQQRLFNWYHNALNAFNSTCPAGAQIFARYRETLIQHLNKNSYSDEAFDLFIEQCREKHATLTLDLHEGRDRLLEYSSCRTDIAEKLQSRIELFEQQSTLTDWATELFDCYGINIEEHKTGSYILAPSEHMACQFPGLDEDGMTVTFEREVALIHDDMHFLSWDHPMIINGIDMLLSNEMGNTAVCSIKSDALTEDIKPGQLLIQMNFILDIEIPTECNLDLNPQQLQALPVSIICTEDAKELQLQFNYEALNNVDRSISKQIIQLKENEIKNTLNKTSSVINEQASEYLQAHYNSNLLILENEIDRLTALQKVNPQIRDEEITFFKSQLEAFQVAFEHPVSNLDSLMIVITT